MKLGNDSWLRVYSTLFQLCRPASLKGKSVDHQMDGQEIGPFFWHGILNLLSFHFKDYKSIWQGFLLPLFNM